MKAYQIVINKLSTNLQIDHFIPFVLPTISAPSKYVQNIRYAFIKHLLATH